ncbi:hypothetical protein HYS93_01355 [Candidatus Daviesbacteria bacterium]|nr:hypothetical protein [Candidatus Daviesbacteria bacterium]
MPQFSKKKVLSVLITFVSAILVVIFLYWLNYQMISGWLGKNGPANIGSIEVSYVSMGRFLVDFGLPVGGSSWAPFWYLGFPFHVFYTPLLPVLEAMLHKFWGFELWEAYRNLTGFAYIVGPVSLFFLAWQLSKRLIGGVVAGVLYSVLPTIFYFILESGEVAQDRFSADFWDPRRFTILVRWGEGPHLFSLIFIPIAGLFFARFLEKPKRVNLFLTAIFVGLVGLTNAIGLFATILLMASMAFVKFCQSDTNRSKNLLLFILAGVASLGLISFWYNLTFLSTFFREGGGTSNILISSFPWGWIAGFVAIFIAFILIRRFIKDFGLASSLVWFLLMFTVVATYYLSAPPDESAYRIELLPQALRYNAEVDLSMALLIGIFVGMISRLLERKWKMANIFTWALVIVFLVFSSTYIKPFVKTANQAASEVVDLEKTSEFKVAQALKEDVDLSKGERVFISGNYGFYLNWFSNIWQLRGGLYQASTNRWPDHIYYQLTNGKSPEIADAWLRIINAKYAVITTPGSTELYHDTKNFERFENYPVKDKLGADIIYQIPLKKESLSKSINLDQIKNIKVPVKADDKERILRYINWLENSSPNQLDFKVINNSTYQITGKIDNREGILVQMTADSGWSAYDKANKVSARVSKDPLGFILLEPKKFGQIDIILKHSTTWQVWLGYLISFLTLGLFLSYPLFGNKIISKLKQNSLHNK